MLRVESVSKHYAGKHALKTVSLKADSGKIHGLLGPNGAGKTSLIRIITGIT
ncbi:MAG: ATP-binding cassette domain-containing protein, partial [Bacteroidota bacterium]|nr:ATP-binding cassette domain-containing protein [Bacteroidota bacterium]MDX5430122.1 ATP-binding cassette domain-containing protein [Bacteroidota bacterium]MDX5468883.1 ATP-binding cassette domain-containing protein [Bacteroidota bacterium]